MGVSAGVTVSLARQLVEDYGREAEEAARDRAEALRTYGNCEAAAVWNRVYEILRRKRLRYRPTRRLGSRDMLGLEGRQAEISLTGPAESQRR